MKTTVDNIAETCAKQEFLDQLKSLKSELQNLPATECIYKFTHLL